MTLEHETKITLNSKIKKTLSSMNVNTKVFH